MRWCLLAVWVLPKRPGRATPAAAPLLVRGADGSRVKVGSFMGFDVSCVYDGATQRLCHALCSDDEVERRAELLAGEAYAAFESWVRATLADHECAEDLDKANFVSLMQLMRP